MNIKEAFRYQNSLGRLMSEAKVHLRDTNNCRSVTKLHKRSAADPNMGDITEAPEPRTGPSNDQIISFMSWLVEERNNLSVAIGKAKKTLPIDLDAEIETNKFRRSFSEALSDMLRVTPKVGGEVRIEQGRGYRINEAGDQTPLLYDIEVTTTPSYDVSAAKATMRKVNKEADKKSPEIEAAMINTEVDYTPIFEADDDFEDVMELYLASH